MKRPIIIGQVCFNIYCALLITSTPSNNIIRVKLGTILPNGAPVRLTRIPGPGISGRPLRRTALHRLLLRLQLTMDGDDFGRKQRQHRQGRSEEDTQGTYKVLLLLTALPITRGVINGDQNSTKDDQIQILNK